MEYNILRDWLSNHQFTWEKLGDILTYHHNAPILFSSGLFFFLFIGFLMIYMSLRKHTLARIIYVTLFSLYFYYKSSGLWFGLLVFTATSDFLIAQCISHTTSVLKRKLFVTLSLCINLGMLGYFKYFNFLGELFTMAAGGEWLKMNIFLPVGISFFTFQSISYVIDVYRGRIQPLGRWIDYVFYVSFFPQLVAGPIVRARDFIPQMYKNPTVTRSEFGEGLFLILCGLFKKTVISDYISMNFVDRIFDAPLLYTGVENLLGVYGYALQIYCDFSGYSDMAIGIAREVAVDLQRIAVDAHQALESRVEQRFVEDAVDEVERDVVRNDRLFEQAREDQEDARAEHLACDHDRVLPDLRDEIPGADDRAGHQLRKEGYIKRVIQYVGQWLDVFPVNVNGIA